MIRALVICLLAVAAQPTSAEEPPAAEKKDEKICKRITETGSRVGSTRICKTAEEWRREQDAAKDATRRMQQSRGSTKGG